MDKKPRIILIRTNTRVRPDQHAFIKKAAAKAKLGEGEMTRVIIDYYMNKPK